MNSYFFEGSTAEAPDFLYQVYDGVNHWFFIKGLEKKRKAIDLERKKKIILGWKPRPPNWLKFDIGYAWNKIESESGASWVLRNNVGRVFLHGRISFSGIYSRTDASMESWLWAIP